MDLSTKGNFMTDEIPSTSRELAAYQAQVVAANANYSDNLRNCQPSIIIPQRPFAPAMEYQYQEDMDIDIPSNPPSVITPQDGSSEGEYMEEYPLPDYPRHAYPRPDYPRPPTPPRDYNMAEDYTDDTADSESNDSSHTLAPNGTTTLQVMNPSPPPSDSVCLAAKFYAYYYAQIQRLNVCIGYSLEAEGTGTYLTSFLPLMQKIVNETIGEHEAFVCDYAVHDHQNHSGKTCNFACEPGADATPTCYTLDEPNSSGHQRSRRSIPMERYEMIDLINASPTPFPSPTERGRCESA